MQNLGTPALPDLPHNDLIGDKTKLWAFWTTLTTISAFNIGFFIYYFRSAKANTSKVDKSTASYQTWLRFLAVPFVFECGWRSVLPSIYTQRTTFWDSPLNSIMVDRTLACIGEVAWSLQFSLILRRINEDVGRVNSEPPAKVVKIASYVIPILAVFGELFSYTCVATTNNIYCAVENSFWTAQFVLLAPCCAYLFSKIQDEKFKEKDIAHPKFFVVIAVLMGIFYVPYMIFFNLPMYLDRWHTDNKNGKKYFGFFDGMKDATIHWDQSWHWEDWDSDWFWMVWYFTYIVWTSIWMMKAPRIKDKEDIPQSDAQLDTPLLP